MNSAERREARYQRRKAARMEKKAAALREYGDFETVFSFERLYESYRASVRGVGWKASTQRYKAASLANVTKTHEELIAGRYRSKGFYEFDIVERGKPRHIRSVHISERVVQRCLCDYCLVPMLSRSFIYDNGASLRGKGYDFAVSRVTHFLAEHYRKHGREGYVLVFDFSKYFDTAQHEPVFREFERSGIDDRLVALSKYFIQNFGDVGLGLGSQTSNACASVMPHSTRGRIFPATVFLSIRFVSSAAIPTISVNSPRVFMCACIGLTFNRVLHHAPRKNGNPHILPTLPPFSYCL